MLTTLNYKFPELRNKLPDRTDCDTLTMLQRYSIDVFHHCRYTAITNSLRKNKLLFNYNSFTYYVNRL